MRAPLGGDNIYPARTHRLDYEGELAIVLGKPAKDFKATDDLKPYVWGVTLFGDWSIRGSEPRGQLRTYKYAMAKKALTARSRSVRAWLSPSETPSTPPTSTSRRRG